MGLLYSSVLIIGVQLHLVKVSESKLVVIGDQSGGKYAIFKKGPLNGLCKSLIYIFFSLSKYGSLIIVLDFPCTMLQLLKVNSFFLLLLAILSVCSFQKNYQCKQLELYCFLCNSYII